MFQPELRRVFLKYCIHITFQSFLYISHYQQFAALKLCSLKVDRNTSKRSLHLPSLSSSEIRSHLVIITFSQYLRAYCLHLHSAFLLFFLMRSHQSIILCHHVWCVKKHCVAFTANYYKPTKLLKTFSHFNTD